MLILFIILMMAAGLTMAAEDAPDGLRFICTDGTTDHWQFQADQPENWVLVTQGDNSHNIYPEAYQHITTPSATDGVMVWHETSAVFVEAGDKRCDETGDQLPGEHDYAGVECAGFVVPELAGQPFYVDGQEYHVNADGTISWVVPETALWTWMLYDNAGNLFAVLVQTEVGNCSVYELYPILNE